MGKGISKKTTGMAQLLSMGAVVGAAVGLMPTSEAYAANKIIKTAEHVKGELIVKLKDSGAGPRVQGALFSALNRALGPNAVLSVKTFQTDKSIHKVKIANDAQLTQAIRALRVENEVQYAEPNYIYRHTSQPSDDTNDGSPNDADFTKLWGMKNTGQTDTAGQVGTPGSDINVLPLWKGGMTGSRNVVVAIIDTGIQWDHPDLVDNLYTNPGEAGDKAANGVDDDGNGFIDDVHGWNFADKSNMSSDDHDHGTHCAGTIGGSGNNAQGVAGVNWQVTMMPVKFLDAGGSGSLEGAVESINYARMMKVNIMSNSWGGGGFSEILRDAIAATKDAGVLFVAAAGNDSNNNDTNPSYPASYEIDNIVSVAATDNQDKIARFSNYGARAVHVAAPGVKVYSTVKDGKYDTFSGTSMATPHVSGIAALMWSVRPDWNYAEIKDRLIKTSKPVAGLKRKVVAKGRVDAYAAMNGIVPPSQDPDESLWKTIPKAFETEHPYKDHAEVEFKIERKNAKFVRVIFDQIETEANYDKISIIDGAGNVVEEISGRHTNYVSEYVQGDTLTVKFKADESNVGFGFKVSKAQVITTKKKKKRRAHAE